MQENEYSIRIYHKQRNKDKKDITRRWKKNKKNIRAKQRNTAQEDFSQEDKRI